LNLAPQLERRLGNFLQSNVARPPACGTALSAVELSFNVELAPNYIATARLETN
jgi:hypothetical protein